MGTIADRLALGVRLMWRSAPLATLLAGQLHCVNTTTAHTSPEQGRQLTVCIAARVDTSTWVERRSHTFGVRLLMPPAYEYKTWSESAGMDADSWWRDGRPVSSLSAMTADAPDSARVAAARATFTHYSECRDTRSGRDARVALYRSGSTAHGKRVTSYAVYAEWPIAGGRRFIVSGDSPDSLGQVEQLAIIQSVRFFDSTLFRNP